VAEPPRAELLRTLFDHAPDGCVVTRLRDHQIVLVNEAFCRLLGYTESDLVGHDAATIGLWPTAAERREVTAELLAGRPHTCPEAQLQTRTGETRDVEISAELVDIDGEPHAYGINRDITARKQTERALQASEERFRTLVYSSRDAILVTDNSGVLTYCSPGVEHVLGYEPVELVCTRERDLLHPDDLALRDDRLARLPQDCAPQPAVELRMRHRSGQWRWVEAIDTNCMDAAAINGIVTNVRDVTERRRTDEQLTFRALHDPLTGLANRRLLNDHIGLALARAQRSGGTVAVFFCDLDRFKDVNDRFGHDAGDKLLQQLARRLADILRSSDTLARIGGDEFVLCTDLVSVDDVGDLCERIVRTVDAPVQLPAGPVTVTMSIGIATVTGSDVTSTEPSTLVRNADVAMYRAKNRGRNRWEIFDEVMQKQVQHRVRLEHELERALATEQFLLYYQPIVRLPETTIAGVEALLRWQHPVRGLLAPAEFLEVAADNGSIIKIGEWVLLEAARQLRRWQRQGWPSLWASVNVSGKQLGNPGLREVLTRSPELAEVAPGTLRLELTESVLLRKSDAISTDLDAVVARDMRVGMDDFGTGYCSLSHLQDFPISFVKIDRSFVADLGSGQRPGLRANLVKAIVQLSRTLSIDAIAEGVETPAQSAVLDKIGCPYGQGFHYATPRPAEAMTDLLVSSGGEGAVSGDSRAPGGEFRAVPLQNHSRITAESKRA
jgi:diguanylate cyclase (GGDEF)-like protein/PAS domain S-box-containing protein